MDHILESSYIPKFSERFSAKLYKYETAEDYYQKASCVNYIQDIKTPLLVANTLDDPSMEFQY